MSRFGEYLAEVGEGQIGPPQLSLVEVGGCFALTGSEVVTAFTELAAGTGNSEQVSKIGAVADAGPRANFASAIG